MKKITIIIFTLLSLECSAQSPEKRVVSDKLYFEDYDPPSTLVVPENKVTSAKYPFIDVHSHQWGMGSKNLDILAGAMNDINMAVMVNLSGGSGSNITSAIDNINNSHPNRFIVFANVDFDGVGKENWTKNAVAQLEEDVKNGAKGLKIFKSLGLYQTDVDGNRIPVDDQRLYPIWEKCGELGIPVLIHSADPKQFWEPHDNQNERWLELKLRPRRKRSDTNPAPWQQIIDEQLRMFKRHPQTTFINAHMGWYANNLSRLSEIMEMIPNMYVEIGAVIAELGRQPRNARAFLTKYQNRILFGKDAWNPEEYHTYFRVLETEDEYFPYYKRYHAFWKMYGLGLPDEVLKKLYYKNALKIIPNIDESLFPH